MTNQHPQEIELKLQLPPGEVDAFLKRMARRRTVPRVQTLATLYFDTPGFALSAAGVALRVRRAGRRWLQTLKTEGERGGGLSRRIEYEMPVRGGTLDWTRFPPEALAHVPDSVRGQVVPVFETRFRRTAWQVKGRGGAQIEVALDVGEVVAGERRQLLCEIELELKAGQPDALFALALDWADAFDCLPFDVSKAERGVRLAHGVAAAPMKSAPVALARGLNVEDGFAAIVQGCLAQFQANLPGVLSPLTKPLMNPLSDRPSPQAGKSTLIPQTGAGANVMPTPMASRPLPNPLPQTGEGVNVMPTPMASRPLPNPLPQAGEGANVMPTPINEYVHQARVALRRLRAALRLFRGVCVLPDALSAGLRALAAALGPARDWDVLVGETLPAIAPHCPDADAWQRGLAAIEARRHEVRAAMQTTLHAAQPGRWLLGMQRWLQQYGWRADAQRLAQLAPLDDWARRALKRGHRRITRDARMFDRLQPMQRHALRIAIKRQRYAVEFFQPLFAGKRQVRYLAVLRDAQDSLGRANDAHVAWGLLASMGPAAGPMGDFVRGWLAAQLAASGAGESAKTMQTFLDTPTGW